MGTSVVVRELPNCDICGIAGKSVPAYADAYLPTWSTWGNVCKPHFNENGCKLGTGAGQELVFNPDNGRRQ
jgi:hypothetical protein